MQMNKTRELTLLNGLDRNNVKKLINDFFVEEFFCQDASAGSEFSTLWHERLDIYSLLKGSDKTLFLRILLLKIIFSVKLTMKFLFFPKCFIHFCFF